MRRLMRLFRKRKLEAQLDSELRFHLDQRAADLVANGVAPAEARRRGNSCGVASPAIGQPL